MARASIALFHALSIRSRIPQYESELITSPPLMEPSATQVWGLTEFFTKRTEPSPKRQLTPPGCRLREPQYAPPSLVLAHANCWTGWVSHNVPAIAGLKPGV